MLTGAPSYSAVIQGAINKPCGRGDRPVNVLDETLRAASWYGRENFFDVEGHREGFKVVVSV